MVQQQVSLDELKTYLGHIIEEWLGGDIPDEGTEDYAQWDSMRDEIEAVRKVGDVVNFLDGRGIDSEEWFENLGLEFPVTEQDLTATEATRLTV